MLNADNSFCDYVTFHCLVDLDVDTFLIQSLLEMSYLSLSSGTPCWGEEKYKPEDTAGTESMEVAAMSAKPRRLKKAGNWIWIHSNVQQP